VLDIAQSLLGGSYSRARILPEWLTKNYTTGVGGPNNIYLGAGLRRFGAGERWRVAVRVREKGRCARGNPHISPGQGGAGEAHGQGLGGGSLME